MRAKRSRSYRLALPLASVLLILHASLAGAVILDMSRSPDVPIALANAGGTLHLDGDVIGHRASPTVISTEDVGTIPNGVGVAAFHYAANSDALFVVDIPVDLGGTLFLPADVIRYDALAGTYGLEFDSSTESLDPAGIDALTMNAGDLVFSFDTTVLLEGLTVEPGDLVQWSPGNASLLFDASAEGLPSALNVDAAHLLPNGRLLLSFDTSGNLGGVDFDDEDIVEFDPLGPSFALEVDGSALDGEWLVANADALHVVTAAEDNCPSVLNPDQRDIDGDLDGDACDLDADGDGISNADEIGTYLTNPLLADTDADGLNDYDEIFVHLLNPLDPDMDGDGLLDGAEIAQGSDPQDEDTDDDGFCDGSSGVDCTPGDNCPLVASSDLTNSDSLPAGDVCQCADVTDDGIVDSTDLSMLRKWLVDPASPLASGFVSSRCNMIGPSDGGVADCDVADAFVLDRFLSGGLSSFDNVCADWLGP